MPELPEAETIARGLHAALCGGRFTRVTLNRTDIVRSPVDSFIRRLTSRCVSDVTRRGKRVVVHLDNEATLVFDLGMTGRLTLDAAATDPAPHTHLRIAIDGGPRELRFRDTRRFGGVWLLDRGSPWVGPRLGPLGDEPLDLNIGRFRILLSRKRQIKALLLDQRIIAGLGNIYCDEALHRAGIHPLTRACELSRMQSARLLRHIRAVLRAAIECEGSTFMDYRTVNDRPGGFQLKHRVYNRRGLSCRTCRSTIERIVAAGRSTHVCPTCQPLPG